MGRVIQREVVAFRCELRSCMMEVPAAPPASASATWHTQAPQLARLVEAGWGFVLTPQLRAYCPDHADRVWQCSCRQHPDRVHLCTVHDGDAASRVWDRAQRPVTVDTMIGAGS